MSENINSYNEGKVLLIDKPLNWTSFDVVKKLKFTLKVKKIGHAGTLDPLATGLLILCTGKMTKSIEKYQAQEKEYTGEFTLGYTTPSYDLETEPEFQKETSHLTLEDLKSNTAYFTGEIEQTPPIFSAVKTGGKRAYSLAREGKEVKLKSRVVTISEFEITDFKENKVSFRVRCSKGTYIRSLAHDFGEKLGVGAYLSALRRTKIGDFSVEDADNLNEFVKNNKVDTNDRP
ncbi:tRNA pseudouridine synthase B [Marivirga tractuosa]|uniref:tRNA pseudouridine synthase B n=1 Tax=Marivirga tractuosa (strain ATCC 23168 / DSM 4126 / NBRC 15989 / NCIMB 1408 / VKM B-1430 / H-43) TaxID=643867 RepID=E4TSG2_MARTH|nr:tRNA pseudouridine(55) synthase TruB [Marivirga tractuosa]ADR20782.1 tRNA pseudouridine synthase B [Marivirga tractuosa DSM 4126]BDD14767.1 tRNA pseudouridine synthase B [Marivirga tractuosa]